MNGHGTERRRHHATSLVTAYVATGQLTFALFIALCVALHPGLVLKANEGGMSNYGVHLKTVAPYTIALATPAVCSWIGAYYASRADSPSRYATVLRWYAGLIALTLLTTYVYTLTTPLKYLHIAVGIAITLFETGASWWMYRLSGRHHVLITVQLVGFALEVGTFVGALHLLFVTQLLTGGAFALLLVATSHVDTPPRN